MTGNDRRSLCVVLIAAIWAVQFTRSGGWPLLYRACSGQLYVITTYGQPQTSSTPSTQSGPTNSANGANGNPGVFT